MVLSPVLSQAIARVLQPIPLRRLDEGGAASWTPALWFLANEQGLWLDPSDFTRYMSELGPELVTNGDFSGGTTGWTPDGTLIQTVTAGVMELTGNGGNMVSRKTISGLTVGAWYTCSGVLAAGTGGRARVSINMSGTSYYHPGQTGNTALTPFTNSFKATATSLELQLCIADSGTWGANGDKAYFDNISVRELTAINTATLFQDSAGTTPVTAVEQPVGLALDKRLGLVLGAEKVSNGDFASATNWITGANWSISGGIATANGVSGNLEQSAVGGYVTGSTYRVTYTVTARTAGTISAWIRGTFGLARSAPGTYTEHIVAGSGGDLILFSGTGFAGSIDNISVRELPGNHASQPTTAQKPVLSARKNQLTYSEDLANAAWGKPYVTVVANSAAASDGTITADKVVPTAANAVHQIFLHASGITVVAGQRWTGSIDLKADGYGFCYVELFAGAANGLCVNLATGAITNTSGGLVAGTVEDKGNGWWRVNITADTTAAYAYLQAYPRGVAGPPTAWLGDGVNGVLMTRAQLELGPVATTYQRVTTATSYDEVGFPLFEFFDGVDDNQTAAAGGGASTAFTLLMGVRPTSIGTAKTLWSDRSGNTGLKLGITAGGNIEFSGGNGAAIVAATGAVMTVNTDYVVTATYDGASLSVQLNNGAATTAACVLVAGTAGFTIGKDNGAASGNFTGRIYETIHVKDVLQTAPQIAEGKAFIADKMQVTL